MEATFEIASTLTERIELGMVARPAQLGSDPKYVMAGMPQMTYLQIGGATTRLICTTGPELLNSPGITQDLRTKP